MESEDFEQVVAQLTFNFMRVKELSSSGVQLHFVNSGTAMLTCGQIMKEIYLVHVEM